MVTRRSLIGCGVVGGLTWPWFKPFAATAGAGVTDSEVILGMSAAFSGPSRGLGIELYRGAWAYLNTSIALAESPAAGLG